MGFLGIEYLCLMQVRRMDGNQNNRRDGPGIGDPTNGLSWRRPDVKQD